MRSPTPAPAPAALPRAGLAASNPGLQKMLMGVFGLPIGLTMVLVTGGELFTGNTALVTVAALEGKASLGQLAKSWVMSYIGNALGAALVVSLLYASGLFSAATAPLAVAAAKSSLPFGQAFVRGIVCNWMVCMAIWQSLTTTTFPGKFLAAVLPVSAFVAIGLEHSIANMFFVPLGMALGAPVTMGQFCMNNLLPVTLGNIVGGALGVAVTFAYIFGRLGKPKAA
jgi:formate/nitrite transporter